MESINKHEHHNQIMSNKTALITGAAKRIGAAIATRLHDLGMDVIVHFNESGNDAKLLVKGLNEQRSGSAHLLQADLGESGSYHKLIDDACAVNNRLDILINNASLFYPTPVKTTTIAQWDEIIRVNLAAPFFLARDAAPYLSEKGGCIINLADIYAERPLKDYSIYSISKAGLIALTKSLAKELGPAVRVNAISPGAVFWPEDMAESARREVLAHTVFKRQGETEDICNAVQYLIESADYMTGQVLTIDGGRMLHV